MEKLLVQEDTKTFFLRASSEWIKIAHKKERTTEYAYGALDAMEKFEPGLDFEEADKFLRKIVSDNVFQRGQQSNNPNAFPGPSTIYFFLIFASGTN
jgi:hypothetical protein